MDRILRGTDGLKTKYGLTDEEAGADRGVDGER